MVRKRRQARRQSVCGCVEVTHGLVGALVWCWGARHSVSVWSRCCAFRHERGGAGRRSVQGSGGERARAARSRRGAVCTAGAAARGGGRAAARRGADERARGERRQQRATGTAAALGSSRQLAGAPGRCLLLPVAPSCSLALSRNGVARETVMASAEAALAAGGAQRYVGDTVCLREF